MHNFLSSSYLILLSISVLSALHAINTSLVFVLSPVFHASLHHINSNSPMICIGDCL